MNVNMAERISSYKETELVSHLLILGGGSDTVLFDLRCLTLLLASFAWLLPSLIIPGVRVHTQWPVFAMHGHARTKKYTIYSSTKLLRWTKECHKS